MERCRNCSHPIFRLMIRQEDVYKIGRIGRPHGVKGELVFWYDDDVFDRVDCDYLVLSVDGILVPFFIDEYRFRSADTVLLKLCDVDTQERAAALTGCDVYFPTALGGPDEDHLSLAALVGYMLVSASDGTEVGRIVRVDDATANILFELEDGRLIPAAEELMEDLDTENRKISVRLPDGLLDI